ncbi:MAG: hypothetical protein ACI841_003239 [Planctomycetota bacterium]
MILEETPGVVYGRRSLAMARIHATAYLRRLQARALRTWYPIGMYTGIRSAVNRLISCFYSLDSRLDHLQGYRIRIDAISELTLHLHARPTPNGAEPSNRYAVASLQLLRSPIPRWKYRFLCNSSHFGCGHIEVAFYEREGALTIYGIRNIARANAERIGWHSASERLSLQEHGEDQLVLQLLCAKLNESGFATRHAKPDECLNLSVDPRLISRKTLARTTRALHKKYVRLHSTIEATAGQGQPFAAPEQLSLETACPSAH